MIRNRQINNQCSFHCRKHFTAPHVDMLIICSAKRVVISSCVFRNSLIPLSSTQRSSEDDSEEQEFSEIIKTPRYRFLSKGLAYLWNLLGPYVARIVLRFYATGAFLSSVGDAEHLTKNIECSYS